MQYQYQTFHQVSTYDVDFKKRLRYSQLLKYMQEAAQMHSEQLQVGHSHLEKKNYAWILGRLKINMNHIFYLGDQFSITTFPGPRMKYVYPRYFVFKDENQKVIGLASSLWTIFDVRKREVVRGQENVPYPDLTDVVRPLEHPRQIEIEDLPNKASYQTKYSDIDTNMHANNTNYVEWLFDLFSIEFLKQHYPVSLQINYLHEIPYQKEFNICYEADKQDSKFIGYDGETAMFCCEMKMEAESK